MAGSCTAIQPRVLHLVRRGRGRAKIVWGILNAEEGKIPILDGKNVRIFSSRFNRGGGGGPWRDRGEKGREEAIEGEKRLGPGGLLSKVRNPAVNT